MYSTVSYRTVLYRIVLHHIVSYRIYLILQVIVGTSSKATSALRKDAAQTTAYNGQ